MDPSRRHPGDDADVDLAFARFVARRDPDDIGVVFDRTATRLTLVAARLVGGDRHAAEDVVQRTFLEALRSADRFRVGSPVVPWLLGILTHEAARVRRERRPDPVGVVVPDGVEADHAGRIADRELADRVEAAVRELPKPYREVVALRLLHGLEPVAIATALDRPLGTVRSQLHRGLERLRRSVPAWLAGLLGAVLPETRLHAMRAVVVRAARTGSGVACGAGVVWSAVMMKKTVTMLVVVAALVLPLVVLWPKVEPAVHAPGEGSQPSVATARVDMAKDLVAAERGTARTPGAGRTAVDAPVAPNRVRFVGQVVARETGAPLAGARVRLSAYSPHLDLDVDEVWTAPEPVVTEADGYFVIEGERPDRVAVEVLVTADGRVEMGGGDSDLRAGVEVDLGVVPLAVACPVRFRLLDHESRPLAMRQLEIGIVDRFRTAAVIPVQDLIPGALVTDEAGETAAVEVPPGRMTVRGGSFRVEDLGGIPAPHPVEPALHLVDAGDRLRWCVVTVPAPDLARVVRGVVVDREERPVPHFHLVLARPAGSQTAWTDAEGRFEVRGVVPDAVLTPRAADAAVWRVIAWTEPLCAGGLDARVVVDPIPLRNLVLQVIDSRGTSLPCQGLSILQRRERNGIHRLSPARGWSVRLEDERLSSAGRTVALHDGRYVVVGMRDAGGRTELAWWELAVPASTDVVELPWPEQIDWRIRVLTRDGKSVSNARAAIRHALEPRWWVWDRVKAEETWGPDVRGLWQSARVETAHGTTDAAGIVTLHAPHNFGPGAVIVFGDGLQSKVVDLPSTPIGGKLEVTVDPGGTLIGRVHPPGALLAWLGEDPFRIERERLIDDGRSRFSGWSLELGNLDEDGARRTQLAEDGSFRLASVPSGTWTVRLTGPNGASFVHPRSPIAVPAGEVTTLDLDLSATLPAGVRGTAIVPPGVSSAVVGVIGTEYVRYAKLEAEGRFEIPRLPGGRYEASVRWSDAEGRSCGYLPAGSVPELLAGRTTTLMLAPPFRGAVAIQLVDDEGMPLTDRAVEVVLPGYPASDSEGWLARTTDDSGRFTLDPIPAAVIAFRVGAAGQVRIGDDAISTEPIRISADAPHVERRIVVHQAR